MMCAVARFETRNYEYLARYRVDGNAGRSSHGSLYHGRPNDTGVNSTVTEKYGAHCGAMHRLWWMRVCAHMRHRALLYVPSWTGEHRDHHGPAPVTIITVCDCFLRFFS